MIEEVELVNFLSHGGSRLRLGEGVNVFIGPNGAGKSSVIDAITYALFGKHARGDNENIVRRGAHEGWVAVTFTLGGRRFRAERKFGAKGRQEGAVLFELLSEGKRPLISGERRKLEESMSEYIEQLLGLDYEKLRVAALIQQGQLESIIEYDPRKFKELLNSIVGIDRLDRAFEAMKEVIDGLRARLRERCGYDDTQLEDVRRQLAEKGRELEEKRRLLQEVRLRLSELERQEAELEGRRALLERAREAHRRLQDLREELYRYVVRWRSEAQRRVQELERTLEEAKGRLPLLQQLGPLRSAVEGLRAKREQLDEQLARLREEEARYREQLSLASRLQFKDNICPVCGSRVERVTPLFDVGHLTQHLDELQAEIRMKLSERQQLEVQERELRENLEAAEQARSWLTARGIEGEEALALRSEELERERAKLARLPAQLEQAQLSSLAVDEHTSLLVKKIAQLEPEAKAFSEEQYSALEEALRRVRREKEEKRALEGRYGAEIAAAEQQEAKLKEALALLEPSAQLMRLLAAIREKVYHRDGPLALSLRSWALEETARRATEYIRLFELGISAISLREEKRAVDIVCRSNRGELGVKALSGGEKVAVALALRFGMASLIAAGKLDFMILDEPTVHLDRERKEMLVSLLNRFNEGGAPLRQIIIISHDEEVFGHASVSELYRFSRRAEGSSVERLLPQPPSPELEPGF